MASDAPDWQWVINATVVPPITDGPDWEFVGVAPGGGPLTGYASLTGPGQTTTPGDLTQAGGLQVNVDSGSATGFTVVNSSAQGIDIADSVAAGIDISSNNSIINLGDGPPYDIVIAAQGGGNGVKISGIIGVNVEFPIGFGQTPVAQATITGSRGGNAALASLLSALANYGLIIDDTTP